MKHARTIIYISLSLALLMWWEYAAKNSNVVRVLISSPSLIVDYFANNYTNLIEATWVTFCEALAGLIIATAFSFGAMIFCFYFPKLMEFILPIMIVSQVIPLITLAPLFILILGIGIFSKMMMSALLCFFPIFINFANGIQTIPKSINELVTIYNASIKQKITNVYFPLALPNIMTGLKISATLSVIGAIVAEFSGAEKGIGRNLFISAVRLEPELMVSSLFMSTIIGFSLFGIILLIEKKLGFWYLKTVV